MLFDIVNYGWNMLVYVTNSVSSEESSTPSVDVLFGDSW